MKLGYFNLSQKIIDRMLRSEAFAAAVGRAVREHALRFATAEAALNHGVRLASQHLAEGVAFSVVTEHDKNRMPRTAIMLIDEGGGCL